ncbi:MAG: serpin family protein [Candidatus Zixiibacteriota bacterium]|nr:MAG: serpin family protein [candidate division Zixibacteria bacterium]
MKIRVFVSIFLIAALVQTSVAGESEDQSIGPIVEGNSRFAVDLYRQIADNPGNLFFSPYSISTALAMTYAGARGETEQEMADVLYFGEDQNILHSSLSTIQNELNDIQTQGQVELSVANLLWCAKEYPFLDSYLESNRKFYDADFRVVDFAGAPEQARLAINAWVEEKTKQKIKDLIGPGGINSLTRLVLCNAIYFKGNWQSMFDKDDTQDDDFHVSSATTIKAPMMKQKSTCRYYDFGDLSAVELPYEGERLSMMIFVPKEVDGLANLESTLTFDNLSSWTGTLEAQRPAEVTVIMPRFRTTRGLKLKNILSGMGMPGAFLPNAADFSGMTGTRDLFIGAVVHKAFVDVNEEGTEAAAATGVIAMTTSVTQPPKLIFRADHPFLFLIRENQTGSIVFMGRIVNPTEE